MSPLCSTGNSRMARPRLLALAAAISLAIPATGLAQSVCSTDHYRNSDGRCIHRPVQSPSPPGGATARCRDGSYSFSRHHRGTCSGHGGVAQWLDAGTKRNGDDA